MDHETETVGWITRKHVYEIAKLKSEDTLWQMVDLQDVCKKVIDYAYRMGVKVPWESRSSCLFLFHSANFSDDFVFLFK